MTIADVSAFVSLLVAAWGLGFAMGYTVTILKRFFESI